MGDLAPSLQLPPEAVKNHAMDKITDKIAALEPGQNFHSLEFFPPKTDMVCRHIRRQLSGSCTF